MNESVGDRMLSIEAACMLNEYLAENSLNFVEIGNGYCEFKRAAQYSYVVDVISAATSPTTNTAIEMCYNAWRREDEHNTLCSR